MDNLSELEMRKAELLYDLEKLDEEIKMRKKKIEVISVYGELDDKVLSLEDGNVVLNLEHHYPFNDDIDPEYIAGFYDFSVNMKHLKVTINNKLFDRIVRDYIEYKSKLLKSEQVDIPPEDFEKLFIKKFWDILA